MDSILQTCPRLHSLHIEVPVVFYLPGSWTPSLGAASEPEPGQYNSTFSLQSLILENASFAQTSLEDLLVLTPRLTCLQLRNLRPDTTAADNSSYSWSSLFHQLTALSLTLRSVHFSVHNQAMSEEEVHEKTLVVCPRSTDWVFRSLDFTPSLTACLEQLPNMVTTLELISSDGQLVDDHALALRQYLCASPHLLHLKASQSLCLIERMDVHHRWFPSIRAEATEDRRAGIWACRNLRTLHIRVHNLGSPATQKSTIRPRILFGYISTVLPQLRDLYLYEHENDPGLSLDLMGGLVLLARLRYLEVFRLGTGNTPQEIRPGDVRWMGPAGQNQDGREERTNIVRTWSKVLAAERIAELSRLEAAAQNTAPGYLDAEPEVIEGLNGLGLLSDVKTLVDRMNSQKGYQSWPRLKYLSVYQPGPAARPKMYKVEEGVRQLMMSNSMPVDRGGNNNNIAIMMCGDLSDAVSTAIRGRVE